MQKKVMPLGAFHATPITPSVTTTASVVTTGVRCVRPAWGHMLPPPIAKLADIEQEQAREEIWQREEPARLKAAKLAEYRNHPDVLEQNRLRLIHEAERRRLEHEALAQRRQEEEQLRLAEEEQRRVDERKRREAEAEAKRAEEL